MVFNRGISIGLNTKIPFGGHFIPISIEGESLAWKNLQKNDKKNITSEMINRIIPILIIFNTFDVWFPWREVSVLISRHHWNDEIKVIKNLINNRLVDLNWIIKIIPENRENELREIIRGQGLFVTRWKGWFFFIRNFSWI